MTRATRAAGLVAALAAACGASQNPARPLDAIGADGAFLGETLGERFTPDDDRFRATDRAGRWELREQVTIGGRPVDTVTFHEDDGVLERVRLEIAVRGEQASEELEAWTRELCAALEAQPSDFTPSPLGTPDPDAPEDWDPVITEHTDCDAERDGLRYRIRQQTNSASDFRNANLAITLTPAASGQGE